MAKYHPQRIKKSFIAMFLSLFILIDKQIYPTDVKRSKHNQRRKR